MNMKDCLAPLQVWGFHGDLAVETPWAQQRWIKDVGAVCRSNHDDVGARIEAIEFDQHLVQCLLTFIVAATNPGTTMTANRVNLIHEDDCRCSLARLVEEVTNAGSTDTDVKLHKL